jgi:hypothetical protein
MLLAVIEMALRRRPAGAKGIWSGLALAAFLLRWQQRRARKEGVSLREELRPGDTLVITHTRTPHG